MIQQEQGFGTSQFIETARYQHALETELARSVSTLQPVRAARVHLALPKPSAFARGRDPASASVLVELHAGRSLDANQVASIVHMVASSVPNLLPGSVTVVDQCGHLLTGHEADSELAQSGEQLEYTRRLEADYVRRIEQLLTPMLGPGRVSTQVAADLDFAVTEEARESYKPDPAAVRSEQTSELTSRAPGTPQGVPGATSNQPPPQNANPPLNQLAGAAGDSTPLSQSRQATRNFELDKTISHTRQPTGQIKRLSVAVLVDYLPKAAPAVEGEEPGEPVPTPLSKDELAKVEALVREAVGFNAQRGDTLSVQNAAFLQPEATSAEDTPIWQRAEVRNGARHLGGVLVVLALIFAVVRPVLKNLLQAPLAPRNARPLASTDVRAVGEDRVSLGAMSPMGGGMAALADPYEQKLQQARSAVSQDPKRVAQVIKNWVGQE